VGEEFGGCDWFFLKEAVSQGVSFSGFGLRFWGGRDWRRVKFKAIFDGRTQYAIPFAK